ncbi:variable surface protein [Plasmodium gonderi]|uniref:Variable surface protein n=1 Tax=Plasmodium gonderi TaxID=77519 RepID=A0A1Y1JSD6_PLAGO|nr:variable surface protein [Plasmodium gonderi]GAW84087.1 variable surface protein [Plasmodium gonderi]
MKTSENEISIFDLGFRDIVVYLDYIKKSITEKDNQETYTNCKTIMSCYKEMRKHVNFETDYKDAFDICADKYVQSEFCFKDKNSFRMMGYIDIAFYYLFHLKNKTEYAKKYKDTYLSNIQSVLQFFKNRSNVFPRIFQRIKQDYDEIIQEMETQGDNTDNQISQYIPDAKPLEVMGNELQLIIDIGDQEMIVREEDNAISKEIITTLLVSIFAIMIIIIIGYKVKINRDHIPFLKHKEGNIMKMKNKQNENMVNSFATLEGIYNESTDNKYSLAYISEGY